MRTLSDLIAWSGSDTIVLSLFVAVRASDSSDPSMAVEGLVPNEVRKYALERHEAGDGLEIHEYDAYFDVVPSNLVEYVAGCLHEALSLGAVVAWFGFEGSFHFDHLLTPDVARQIYGLADESAISVVSSGAALESAGWADRVSSARDQLVGA